MEHENEYASRGAGTAGVTLGTIGTVGTAWMLLNGGLNGILGGNNRNCDPGQTPVTKYEQELNAKIAALDTEVKLRDSNIYTDQKILDLYTNINGRLSTIEGEICNQKVYNATLNGVVGCIQTQIAQLQALTKLVIPNSSVCPGWGNVTVTPATATAG